MLGSSKCCIHRFKCIFKIVNDLVQRMVEQPLGRFSSVSTIKLFKIDPPYRSMLCLIQTIAVANFVLWWLSTSDWMNSHKNWSTQLDNSIRSLRAASLSSATRHVMPGAALFWGNSFHFCFLRGRSDIRVLCLFMKLSQFDWRSLITQLPSCFEWIHPNSFFFEVTDPVGGH